MNALVALIAALLDRYLGYPAFLARSIGHPVEWMGVLISGLETRLNRASLPPAARRRNGVLALLAVLALTALVTIAIVLPLRALPFGWAIEALLAAPLLAQKHLEQAVEAVASGLRRSIYEARTSVARIVGRDPDDLDRSGVARAGIESLAENTSDGVVAPLFYLLLLGLPGIALYKAINTADSMLGHRSPRFADFGWASARTDDVVNFIPARLTAFLFALAALALPDLDARAGLQTSMRDAPAHRSPNAGWPEAAMAGALGIVLGGPRAYGGEVLELPEMGQGRRELDEHDIDTALALYRASLLVLLGLMAVCAVLAVAFR